MLRPYTLISKFDESGSFNHNDNRDDALRNNRIIFKACNCNYLIKLQSNDYRHEVELDNNTRKEAGQKEKKILPPQASQERKRERERSADKK